MVLKTIYINPIYEGGDKITPDINPKCSEMHWPCPCNVKITPDINPIYVGIDSSFPYNSKNVSFVDMGLV